MRATRRTYDVLASVGVHGALAAAVAVVVSLHPLKPEPRVVTMEIVKVAPAPVPRAPAEAEPPPLAPEPVSTEAAPAASAPRSVRRVVPAARVAPAAPAAGSLPVPAGDGDDVPGVPHLAREASFAPPAPPPPPAPPAPKPREVTRADADASFVDSGYVRLETLVVSWQHNDDVRGCIEHTLGSGEQLAQLSQTAHERMLDAVRRGDHAAALAEARRVHDAAQSFDALYRRARHCLD